MSNSRILLRVFFSAAAGGLIVGAVVFASYFVHAMDLLSEPDAPAVPTANEIEPTPATTPAALRAPATLPPLPIAINIPARQLSGGGYSAQFHNTSDKPMAVVIDMEATTSHPGKRETFAIPASGTVEIGWNRGWKLMTGDRVTLTCQDYLPGTWKMP